VGRNVRLPRAVTAFTTGGDGRLLHAGDTGEMGVLEELRPNIRVTDTTGIATDIALVVRRRTGRNGHAQQRECENC